MRIAMLYGYGLRGSGSAVYTHDLIRPLCHQGHDVQLVFHEQNSHEITTRGESSWSNGKAIVARRLQGRGALTYHALSNIEIPVTYPRPELPRTVFLSEMDEAAQEEYIQHCLTYLLSLHVHAPIDHVITHHLALLPEVARRFQQQTHVPFSIIAHGTGLLYGVQQSASLKDIAARYLPKAQCVVTLNASLQTRISAEFPRLQWNPLVMAPGIDTQAFRPMSNRQSSLLRSTAPGIYGIRRPTTRTLVYAGRLIADKGLHGLLAAIPHIIRQAPDTRVLIAGEGANGKTLKRAWDALCTGDCKIFIKLCRRACIARATNSHDANTLFAPLENFFQSVDAEYIRSARMCRERVSWMGNLDRTAMARLYRQADLCVLPSLVAEAHPLSLCEALACATPVLGSNHSGIQAIFDEIEHSTPGLSQRFRFIDTSPNWTTQFALQCGSLLARPPSIEEMYKVRRHIRQHYSWEALLSELLPSQQATTHAQERISVLP